jgi:hypothetical protein
MPLPKESPHPLQPLSQKQVEKAFELIAESWETDEDVSEIRIPKSLQHLTAPQWEMLCHLLLRLQEEREMSGLH